MYFVTMRFELLESIQVSNTRSSPVKLLPAHFGHDSSGGGSFHGW